MTLERETHEGFNNYQLKYRSKISLDLGRCPLLSICQTASATIEAIKCRYFVHTLMA